MSSNACASGPKRSSTSVAGSSSTSRFEVAWRQHRRATLMTTVYAVLPVASMDLANERGRDLLLAMGPRSFTAALDLDAREFLTS
jgi:hypothetical protein